MKYIKLYEGFVEKIDNMNSDIDKMKEDIDKIKADKIKLGEQMFLDIAKLFVNVVQVDGKIDADAKLKINSKQINYLGITESGGIKVYTKDGQDTYLYLLGRSTDNKYEFRLLGELYDKCFELYPEMLDADAMGFFNAKGDES